jgi:hypothetical protein
MGSNKITYILTSIYLLLYFTNFMVKDEIMPKHGYYDQSFNYKVINVDFLKSIFDINVAQFQGQHKWN